MNVGNLVDVWAEIEKFIERVFGWLNFVVGKADDPFVFDGFWNDLFDVKK